MSLIPESREKPGRREWFSIRSFAVIAAAVAVVWSTTLVVNGWKASHAPISDPRVIRATGTAKRHVSADSIRWDATVTAHASDEIQAMRRALDATEKTRAFLAAHDVPAPEITIYPASVDPDMKTVTHHGADGSENEEQVQDGFVATQKIEIFSSDVGRGLRAFHDVTTARELGPLEVTDPTCSVSGIDTVQEQLVAAARKDVRVQAEAAIAAIGGARLGKLMGADLGAFEPNSTGLPSLAACQEGETASATVNATYQLD